MSKFYMDFKKPGIVLPQDWLNMQIAKKKIF